MKQIRVAMIGGGGEQNFFGRVHKRAIAGSMKQVLVAGALHEEPDVSLKYCKEWGLPHAFGTYEELIVEGAKRDLFDYVVVTTPNFLHHAPALLALQHGIPVFCEKPLAMNVQQATELFLAAREKRIPFGVNYTYGGHWSQKLARAFVRSKVLGDVRRVNATYWQGWQRVDLGIQQEHRQDPKKSGDFNCNGDINTHNHFAIRNVTGLEVEAVCCVTRIHVAGRVLDDDVDVIHRLSNGGGGLTSASQIACGHWNDHGLDVYCSGGSIRWRQEQPQEVRVIFGDGPEITYVRGAPLGIETLLDNDKMREQCGGENVDRLKEEVAAIGRFIHLPSGHGEDFFEAVGNNHDEFGGCVRAWREVGKVDVPTGHDYASVLDGLRGMEFLAACKANLSGNEKFTTVNRLAPPDKP